MIAYERVYLDYQLIACPPASCLRLVSPYCSPNTINSWCPSRCISTLQGDFAVSEANRLVKIYRNQAVRPIINDNYLVYEYRCIINIPPVRLVRRMINPNKIDVVRAISVGIPTKLRAVTMANSLVPHPETEIGNDVTSITGGIRIKALIILRCSPSP